jgi:glycosyltransferase involved in cell wall biosynthesis
MRVALVLGETTGGVGRHVLAVVRGLAGRGESVHVYAPTDTLARFAFADAGAAVTAMAIPAAPGTRDVGVIGQLRRALREDPVDIVHAHGLGPGLIAMLARTGGVPVIVTWHPTATVAGMRRLAHRVLAGAVARTADLTIGVTASLVRRAVDAGAQRAWLRPLSVPELPAPRRGRADLLDELGVTPDTPIVLARGRLTASSRFDVLVAAAASWRELLPAPAVLLAGTGPAFRHLVGQVAVNRARVVFLGERDDVAELLAAADVAVVTGEDPSFVRKAIAAGVPLVAADVPDVADIAGEAAVLVPAGDVAALAEAVRDLLEDAPRRSALAAAARARSGTWPSERESVDEVLAAYATVAVR